MLFFVDESFQTVGGQDVGALGVAAIPAESYNRFCSAVYRVKRDMLGAMELNHKELKGNTSLTKAQFKRLDESGSSPLLLAVDGLVTALVQAEATTMGLWTANPGLLTLRDVSTTQLTTPYIKLLHYFGHLVKSKVRGHRGTLFLDQVGQNEDIHAACMIANYLARPSGSQWLKTHLIQVPHYTHSVVSPGLQAADLMAYLMAQQSNPNVRPELQPIWERFNQLAWYQHGRTDSGAPQIRSTTGELVGLSWHTGAVQPHQKRPAELSSCGHIEVP